MELGQMIFGNKNDTMRVEINREVFQPLWWYYFNQLDKKCKFNGDCDFENDVFICRQYCWNEESENANLPNFEHKMSGYKITWYKYPLRSAFANKNIDPEEFVQIIKHCFNSLNQGYLFSPDWSGDDVMGIKKYPNRKT